MGKPCEICGDLGITGVLVTCDKCKASTSHEYCLKAWPKRVAEKWFCEDCESNNPAKELTVKPSEFVVKFISIIPVAEKSDSGVPARSTEKELQKGTEPLVTNTNVSQAPKRRLVTIEEAARIKVRRKKKKISEILSIGDRSSTTGTSYSRNELSSYIVDTCAGCTPASDALWKGTFSVRVDYGRWKLDNQLQAHPSSQVLRIIYELPKKLPEMLHFEAVPFNQCWSQFFKDCTPDERDIGLYFFPTDWRSDEWYASLVESISSSMYALRKQVDNVELIVFTSKLLNTKCQLWKGRYYLWGVFNPLNQLTLKLPIPQPVATHHEDKAIKRRAASLTTSCFKLWFG